MAAGHAGGRATRLDRRRARGRRYRARPGRVGEARARRVASRQRSHDRGVAPRGSGAPGPLVDLRPGDRRGRVRLPATEPRTDRHAPCAATERHPARPRATCRRASRGGAIRSRDRRTALGERGPVRADGAPEEGARRPDAASRDRGLRGHRARGVAGGARHDRGPYADGLAGAGRALGRGAVVRRAAHRPRRQPRAARAAVPVARQDRPHLRGFDDRLMAYRLADGQALWSKPPTIDGWVHGIVQHPSGIIILPESPPANQATGNVRIVNGVVQTGLNVARYEDGTTIADKPLRMRGTVTDALITGGSAVLAVDAESRTFVNVLDVATASVRLKKDVKIKGQLDYAELTPAGLLYISRPDAATNAEVNVIDLASGESKFKDAIESGKPLSSGDYNAARYSLHHVVEGTTLYSFASHDHKLYAVDRTAGSVRALGGEIKLQGDEDPVDMEIRPAGIVLIAPQNLVVVARDGQVKQQAYYPAPQLPGLLRALYRINAVRAGLYGAAASAYGDAFAQMSRNATDSTARRLTGQMATAYTQGGAQLAGYSHQAASLASKRFKASLAVPGSVFMLTRAPEGNGNVLLQIDKDSGQPRSRVDLGKEREPVYAVDDVAGMLFLRTAAGTLVGYKL